MQNSTFDPVTLNEFDKTKVNFNGLKAAGVCLAGQSVNVDLPLTDDHFMTGATLNVVNNTPGDHALFQIVHPLAGVVGQYIDWYVFNLSKSLTYPAKIPGGLILRVVYNSVGTQDVQIFVNYDLHKAII